MAINCFRALKKIRKFLSHEQGKHLSQANIMSALKCSPFIWMFCRKTENKFINKIHEHTTQLNYEMEDATFEILLERDNLEIFMKITCTLY